MTVGCRDRTAPAGLALRALGPAGAQLKSSEGDRIDPETVSLSHLIEMEPNGR